MKLVIKIVVMLTVLMPVAVWAEDTCGALCDHDWWKEASTTDVKTEIENGVDVNFGDEYGETPLHIAAEYGSPENIQMLIEAGADVNSKTASGYTPLHVAAEIGPPENVQVLIDAGADINIGNNNGDTALHLVEPDLDKIDILTDAGSDYNRLNNDGEPPPWRRGVNVDGLFKLTLEILTLVPF
jgi:predicted component of type VI protein secretion system